MEIESLPPSTIITNHKSATDYIDDNLSEYLDNFHEDATIAVALPPKLLFDSVEFLNNLKNQFQTCNNEQKIQILTLLTQTWNTTDIRSHFDASFQIIRKAREILDSNGILARSQPKKGKI